MHYKKILKKYSPESILSLYHKAKSYSAALWYGFPARRMVMIGITGTKGKTTTANFTWSILTAAGYKVGLIGTANIRIGDEEYMNEYHMTMPGPWIIESLLFKMRKAGCTHVIMEVTSEGLKLYRHLYLDFDTAIFTNLSPEHLPSHGGSFEKYKEAKGILFQSLMKNHKTINGSVTPKYIVANADNEHSEYYLHFPADKKITFGINQGEIRATNIYQDMHGVECTVGSERYHIPHLGAFNVYNVLPGIILAHEYGVRYEKIQAGLSNLTLIPGRMEIMAQTDPATIIIDYAHEKVSMNALLDTARGIAIHGEKIIVLLGAEGGGRDKAKREHMGRAAGIKADYVIVTNVDPYEDDPMEIIEGVAKFARIEGKKDGETLFIIPDRREAIIKGLRLAKKGDLVLITGKGAEQSMIIGGKAVPWDDRKVVREILNTKAYVA